MRRSSAAGTGSTPSSTRARIQRAFARLGQLRSAGITDLRHGNLLEGDWSGAGRFAHGRDTRAAVPLPSGVACYAIAASMSRTPSGTRGVVLGDGLVPVDSALGRHVDPERTLQFSPGATWVGYGLHHLDLLDAPAVRVRLTEWLSRAQPARRRRSSGASAGVQCAE